MDVKLCSITGFCSGVRNALNLTAAMLEKHGPPVFILHELVHNESVVNDLLARGAKIVDDPEGLPEGATLIFSAHGVSEAVEMRARSLPLNVVDATCPLVHQVQKLGAELSEDGHVVLLFGKAGHREVEGILGRIPGEKHLLTGPEDARAFEPVPGRSYACISQTTMNSDVIKEMTSILREKIPGLVESASVCRATSKRQDAVRELAATCDLGTTECLWHRGGNGNDGILAARHETRANMSFFDGHVTSLTAEQFINGYVRADTTTYSGTSKGVHYATSYDPTRKYLTW